MTTPTSPTPSGQSPTRRWPWVVGGIVAVLFLIGLFADLQPAQPSIATQPAAPTAPAPAAPPAAPVSAASPTAPAPHPLVLPDVAGRNGAIVYDELTELGLKDFTMASQDTEDKLVLFPANWTAVRIEPGPGETVMSDQTVVVTMTKE